MNKLELVEGYTEFLRRYKWNLFGSLTFATRPPAAIADRIFHRWIAEVENGCPSLDLRWTEPQVQQESGEVQFRWVRVAERGRSGDNLHFHVLLGGLRHPSKYPPLLLWNDLAGEALLYYFNPNRHGVEYMIKTVKPGQPFEIDFQLPPVVRE